jgi:GGDEF domain-containing protein
MKYDRLQETLNHMLDEHLDRIALVNKSLNFPQAYLDIESCYINKSLDEIISKPNVKEQFRNDESLDRLNEIKNALQQTSLKLFAQKKAEGVNAADYIEFCNLTNEFVARLTRFGNEMNQEGSGVDPLTGLRSQSVMITDLTRELSACARRGDYLGIALGKIDNFDVFKTKLQKNNIHDLLIFASDVIRKNLRLYDDGYRYKDYMFVMCLKHTDQLGAVSAIERLTRFFREENNSPIGMHLRKALGQDITLSYSVGKLEVGADIHDFLRRLEEDVIKNADEKASVLEYEDISPLAKFAKDIDK